MGADVSQFKEGSARHGILGMYLEETLKFKIKKVDLSTGLKTTLLYITFDDTKSSSTPKGITLTLLSARPLLYRIVAYFLEVTIILSTKP